MWKSQKESAIMKITILIDDKKILAYSEGVKEVIPMISSVDFAKHLNQKAQEMGKEVNLTKIQKLLYICYGSYLAVKGKPIFTEGPKAWDYGPVFADVYYAMKFNNDSLDGLEIAEETANLIKNECGKLVTNVLNHFGDWSAGQLVTWTHRPETAWYKKYEVQGEKYADLDANDIAKEFERYKVKDKEGQ